MELRNMERIDQQANEQDDEEIARESKIYLLVTSRQEPDIKTSLSSLPSIFTVPIQSYAVEEDIKIYVANEIVNDPELSSWTSGINAQIENTIARGSNGIFRWAYCQLDALQKCKKKAAILRTLGSLPKTLDDTYERILLGIDEEYSAEAYRALLWLSFSQRPLTIRELAEAAVIDHEQPFHTDERFYNPERDILDILGNLVTVARPEKHATTTESAPLEKEIRLSHYSVKDYITSDEVQGGLASKFSACNIVPAIWCTKCCLRYIIDVVDTGLVKQGIGLESSPSPDSGNNLPFLRYASANWYSHASESKSIVEASLESLLLQIYLSESVYSTWASLADQSHFPLYVASDQGFTTIVRRLLDTGSTVFSDKDRRHCSARGSEERFCRRSFTYFRVVYRY